MSRHAITVDGFGVFEVEAGTKLVRALEENGVDISHRCGGNARCTTCRVKFFSPEPPMGEAEKQSLEEDGELGNFRLSCQIRVEQPMHVQALVLASEKGWEPGPEVEP